MQPQTSVPAQPTSNSNRSREWTLLGILGLLLALALWLSFSTPSLQAQEQSPPGHLPSLADFLAQAIPVLYEVQERGLRDGWTSIDTSELTVDETVERVLALTG